MTRIMVTGAAGFIGSHTVKLLTRHGNEVLAVDNFSTGKSENLKKAKCKIQIADICDVEVMDKAFSEFLPEIVIHLAAQSAISTAWEQPATDLKNNGIGTLVMLKLAQFHKVHRFIFASTSAVYKPRKSPFGLTEYGPCEPDTPYGISKLACEQYIRLMFPNHMILRYGNVYGPRQVPLGENQVIARALAHFQKGEDFKVVGSGKQKRDFVYVEDVAYANFDAALSGVRGTFNVCSGRSVSVNQVLSELSEIYEISGYPWPHTQEEDPRGDVRLSPWHMRAEVGWTARWSLGKGLKATADWWRSQ